MYTFTYTFLSTYLPIHVGDWETYRQTYAHKYTHTHTCTQTCMHVLNVCMHTRIHEYMHTYIHVYMHTFLYTDTHLYAPLKCSGWYAGRPDCWRVYVCSWAGGRGESQSKQVEIIARKTNRSTCVRTRKKSEPHEWWRKGGSLDRAQERAREDNDIQRIWALIQ